jgi:hypothetical protein
MPLFLNLCQTVDIDTEYAEPKIQEKREREGRQAIKNN